MTLTEIENLSFAELKEKRAELIVAATGAEDLAARYVQARTDAKHRDEKLSEQGRTIDALTTGIEAAKEKEAQLAAVIEAAKAEHQSFVQSEISAREAAGKEIADLNARLDAAATQYATSLAELTADLNAESARANRLKAEALRNSSAITSAAKALNDALAHQQIEDADAG